MKFIEVLKVEHFITKICIKNFEIFSLNPWISHTILQEIPNEIKQSATSAYFNRHLASRSHTAAFNADQQKVIKIPSLTVGNKFGEKRFIRISLNARK